MNNTLEQTILHFLSGCYPKGKSTQEIARAIGLCKGAVGKIMAYLEEEEKVVMENYRWPDDGSITYLWKIR